MAAPTAQIRPYVEEDRKLALFMISKANFAGLATANNKTYTHPVTIAIWLALSSIFIQYMNWWPSGDFGWISYLKPFPALASLAVPVMFAVDWINRPYFEELTQEALRYGDLKDIKAYYSKNPASGFWLLELGDTFVGLIAVDASKPDVKPRKGEAVQPRTAVIRHFHVEENYRSSDIQNDLLEYAINHAFNKDPTLERIEIADSPLLSYRRSAARKAGFELDHNTKVVGVLRWKLGTRYLERNKWIKST
ncbi:hypothetical protein BDN70DRAFT_876342 [Pholiota conissans]|uniref:N-acetyltransferase domain-containing protein n=1 Tax=Pholiota conissans TaxID=109636 RepID=A0A9P5Z5G0_9AGAR|nr:hypothetical protein BDN70DRAFT_876342 [Pholiota conissans]